MRADFVPLPDDGLRELGRPFKLHELEVNMPSFAGRIDTSTEMIRFYLGERHD